MDDLKLIPGGNTPRPVTYRCGKCAPLDDGMTLTLRRAEVDTKGGITLGEPIVVCARCYAQGRWTPVP